MTPEEILNDYFRNSENDAEDAYDQAIEAIKQYAKQMCDKQNEICLEEYMQAKDRSYNQIKNAISEASYPEELL
jgi:hypothetical protein